MFPMKQKTAIENSKQCLIFKQIYQIKMQRGKEFSFPTHDTKNTFPRAEISIQQLYRPQFQVQPHYLNINNLFNIHFCPPKLVLLVGYNNDKDHLFGMLGLQGLQDSIIGSTNFWPAMTLNNEDKQITT